MAPTLSDSACAEQALRGNQDAWRQLVERHTGKVFRLVLRHVRDRHEAQDLTQEVFLQAFTSLSQLRDPHRLGPWLRQIALNLCRQWHRRRKMAWIALGAPHWQEQGLTLLSARNALSEVGRRPPTTTEDTELARIYAEEALRKGLAALTDTLRTAFTLHYLESLSAKEIAGRLQVPEGTVRRRLHDARKRLAEEVTLMTEGQTVLKAAVGIETLGGADQPSQNARLFGRGLHLPAACTIDLATAKDNQDELYLHLIQGDSFLAAECRSIGEFRIKGIPPRKQGEARVKLTLELGPSGELQLRAKEVAGGTLVVAGQPEMIAVSRETA